ncbi:hypothetical protein JL720_7844 [Aureococcus anophagefferens]|nr:hypothetical protein JL720_7844 [Aureococcus anophagefferens]
MSVLWFSNFVLYEEWNFLVFSDLAFAFSVIFVWIWIRVHVGSTVVATISMAQIVFSMPLSLFVYRVFLQITYFSPMQILAIFVILGIGADGVFVYSDAWHQSRGVPAARRRGRGRPQRYPTVSLLWGLDHLSRPKFVRYEPEKHRGDVHYSAPIRLHETAAQQQAWHAATYDGATTYDLGAETFDARLSIFRETTAPTNEVNVVASWKELIGFVDGELRFVRVDAKLSVIEEGAMDKKKRRLGQFNDLVDRVERAGGAEFLGDDLFHSSEAWVWYKTQTALIKGLLLGLSLAFPVAFAVLVLATQNVILATFAIASIGFIVSSVLGACYAMGWHLGVKESIAESSSSASRWTTRSIWGTCTTTRGAARDREAKFEHARARWARRSSRARSRRRDRARSSSRAS